LQNVSKKLIPTTNKILTSLVAEIKYLKVEVESTTIVQSDKNSDIKKNSQVQGKTLGLLGHS
jgi:hypothetical protein